MSAACFVKYIVKNKAPPQGGGAGRLGSLGFSLEPIYSFRHKK